MSDRGERAGAQHGAPPPFVVPVDSATQHWSNRRWVWVFLMGVLILLGALWLVGLRAMANADHLGVLDDPVVGDTATTSCAVLQADVAVARVPVTSSPAVRAASIRRGDEAITRLVITMNHLDSARLDGDDPAVPWLQDWETLRSLRESYADELARGGAPHLVLPTVDGIPISHRMAETADCPVVPELTGLS